MGTNLDEIVEYGEAMSALSTFQRAFVNAWVEHPIWNGVQLAEAAGYSKGPPGSSTLKVTAHRLTHDKKVLAAMDEEANRRMRVGGAIGVAAVVKIALNESHKDHLKAALALMDRTGRHAMSEHKVIVDDKRPETKAELIAAIKKVAAEAGLDEAATLKLIGPADKVEPIETEADNKVEVIEAEFEEIPNMEDL